MAPNSKKNGQKTHDTGKRKTRAQKDKKLVFQRNEQKMQAYENPC